MHPPFPPLPPRPRVALGLAIVAVLAAYAEIRVRSHRSTGPDQRTAQTDRETAARASDASGRFEITGLPDDVSELQVQAQHPELGQALPRALTLADLAGGVVLVLAETGAVSGSVIGDVPGQYHQIEVRSRADRRLYLASTLDGAFWFAQLPAGDYTASLGGEDGRPVTPFHVAAHRTAEISLR